MSEWVTAETILKRAGAPATPDANDTEWAEACADAVNAGFDKRLEGTDYVIPGPLPAELIFAAQTAGVEAYKRREAVFGITGYVDLQGAAIRVSRDYLDAVEPILARYASPGIA
jgi:hypothetical protein